MWHIPISTAQLQLSFEHDGVNCALRVHSHIKEGVKKRSVIYFDTHPCQTFPALQFCLSFSSPRLEAILNVRAFLSECRHVFCFLIRKETYKEFGYTCHMYSFVCSAHLKSFFRHRGVLSPDSHDATSPSVSPLFNEGPGVSPQKNFGIKDACIREF